MIKKKNKKFFNVGGIVMLLIVVSAELLFAQISDNYKLEEYTFNNGGDPQDGVIVQSPSYMITLDSLGESIAGPASSGFSFSMETGFIAWFPPPGEVFYLEFTDKTTVIWSPESSVGRYNLYSGDLSSLSGGYGSCKEAQIAIEQATIAENPPAGAGYFYLVTAENRLNEEGTMGYDSSAFERPNSGPCP